MNKNIKKIFLGSSTVIATLALLAACGTKEKKGAKQADKNETPTLSIFGGDSNVGAYQAEWPVFSKPAAEMGFKLKSALPKTASDFPQEFNLMMASGKIADIVKADRVNFFKFGPEGAFEPLDELIDKYAPNIKKYYEEYPEVQQVATGPDGKIYFIPDTREGKVAYEWYIRQDWLDKLGLKAPDNVDDFYKVLVAFRDQDPNGNGKKDEVPYFNRNSLRGIDCLLPFWGARPGIYVKDGKVKLGQLDSEYETAYKNIRKWYEEGLIDKELYTRKNARDVLNADNIGGMTHDTASATSYNKDLADKIPNFRVNPFIPPLGPDGKRVEIFGKPYVQEFGIGMSVDNPAKEKTMKWIDYYYTEKGRFEANFGVEGETFDVVDGKPKIKAELFKPGVTAAKPIRALGGQSAFGYRELTWDGQQEADPYIDKIKAQYEKEDWIEAAYPSVTYTQEEQTEYTKLITQLDTYTQETVQQWVLGSKPIDFENFKAELKKRGADDFLKIEQTAYDRYVKELAKIEKKK